MRLNSRFGLPGNAVKKMACQNAPTLCIAFPRPASPIHHTEETTCRLLGRPFSDTIYRFPADSSWNLNAMGQQLGICRPGSVFMRPATAMSSFPRISSNAI
uniref:Uncharacterized protein n=1 Tax=Psilocybe cubensis TaxID=181762 RepID=A0A8H7Y9A1_PSICU